MPILSISTIFIHNHAPVLENAAILKNAGKQHFAGVSANNRNQSYFIGIFLQTTPIVQKFTTVSIDLIQLIRAYVLPVMQFLVNHIYPHLVNIIYSTIHIIPTVITYHIQYNYIDITILLSHCNYIVTIIITTLYSYIYRYNLSIQIYNS